MMLSPVLIAAALAAQPVVAVEPYRAQGGNPPWSLTIGNGRMTFESPGRPPVSSAAPAAQDEEGETLYRTAELSVTIMPLACTDKASGRRYSDSVFVEIRDKRPVRRRRGLIGQNMRGGCGGALLPADSLNGTSWHFAEIGGESTGLTGDLLRDDAYAVDFYSDGLKGYGGCNMFRAGYSRAGDVLTVKLDGSTAGLCPEPVMGRERRLMQILSEPMRIGFPDSKTMVLTAASGSIRLIRTESDEP